MDKKKVQSILQDALEEKIPSSEVNLRHAVKTNLVAGTTKQQGANMNTTQPRRIPRVAYATLAIVVLLALAFVTPQGRAFAQNVLQFFIRAESKERPLPQGQAPSPEEAQAMPTAQPSVPFVSMSEAEKIAGFDAKELPTIPQGFEFAGAMASNGYIGIQYQAAGNGGQLAINESTNGFIQSDWDQSPEDAILQVKVNGLDAEIVQGAFVVYPGESVARWNPDAPILRLRWIENGIWFEMTKFGGVESIAYLDAEGMIALAEGME
ncbi:MAG: hypothetical protein C3F07_15035 [Anaerolineales bacterium]|nr:hypothetical protein [Anaerolineae bacterium]PWB71147.1 MAG: hypothetical protein C3F07_15035 [Anaerolineales bacterium]